MFKQKSKTPITVKRASLLVLPVALLVMVVAMLVQPVTPAVAATSDTVNFQARLLTAAGNVVPDGYYNVEFKIYKAASSAGSSQGSCTGDATNCLWTETRIGDDKVRVANGYLTVNLGSVTAFPGAMAWDQQLWLTMNIGGTGSPVWDGEMNPRLKLTATPYSFASGKLVSADGTGSATVANGDAGTICIQNSANCGFVKNQANALQTATTNLKIQGNVTNGVNLSVEAAVGQVANIFEVQAAGGSPLLAVGTAGTAVNNNLVVTGSGTISDISLIVKGNSNMNNASVIFEVQSKFGDSVLRVDGGGGLGIGNATGTPGALAISNGTYFGQILSTNITNTLEYELPNENGTFCLQGKESCGFLTEGSNDFIQNQQLTLQQAGFWAQGTDASKTSFILQAPAASTSDILHVLSGNGTDGMAITSEGAINLMGSGTTTIATPGGANVKTKIKISLFDPGQYGQILAFGLPSSAHATSRAISVFDARSGAHQPTITVFSPDEEQVFGLSWDGSNTKAALKTSSSQLSIATSGGEIALFGSTLVDLNRNTNIAGDLDLVSSSYAYRINGTAVCTSAGCTASSASAIRNSTSQQTTANFWIDGTGKAAALQAASLDAVTAASTLTLGATNATGGIILSQNTTISAGKTLTLAGGNTAGRPVSPAEGTMYYDTTTKQMLVYANGKWQADRASGATKTVAMGATTGCTGSTPTASLNPEGADYVVTSCTSAQTTINSAITALGSTGGTIYLMEGVYIINGPIIMASNIRLVGAGSGTVIKFANNVSTIQSMLFADSTTRIVIEAIRFDGNKANNVSAVAHFGLELDDVGSGEGASAVPGATITNIIVENVANKGMQLSSVANTVISNSYFGQNTSYGVDTNNAGSSVTVTGNTFHDNHLRNMGTSYWTITGNTFDGSSNGNYALDIAGTGHSITGNNFSGINSGINASSSNSTISSNAIMGSNNIGMTVSGSNNVISSNKIHDSAGSTSSRLVITGSGNTITGNDITGVSGTGYAINISSASAVANTLSNNRFSGTGSNTINDLGRDTIYNGQVNGSNDIIIRGMGGLGLNTTNATADASLTLQGGLRVTALPSPAAPTVQKVGTHNPAVATYTYAVTATDGLGETLMSSTGSTSGAASTLSGTVYNRITWNRVSGAISYKIYRTVTTGIYTAGLIGTVNASTGTMQFNDTGIAQLGAVPTANTTGGAYFAGGVTAAKGLNLAYAAGDLFTIQGPSSTFVSVDSGSSKFYIGDASNCSGRFCVAQGIAGTGGSTYRNSYNYMLASAAITSASTVLINQDIRIDDNSTIPGGATNRGIRIDFENSTNANSAYHGLYIKNKSSVSTSSYGGNAIQVDNGSVTTFRASNTGAILVQNTVNSSSLFDIKNAAGRSLLTINSTTGSINVGDGSSNTAGASAYITIGDSGCATRGCVWIGEDTSGTITDSDILQMHGSTALAFSVNSIAPKKVATIDGNGTFAISNNANDPATTQTKGYRFRTNGDALDLQATGVGVAGELWMSGYNTANYSGTQVPFLRMSAQSAAVFVGDNQTTTTPTILVLSSKTTSATDPTGYAGAMYYNAYTARMRCYANSSWSDCMGIPKPNTRKTMYYGTTSLVPAFPAGGTTSIVSPTAFSGYGDLLTVLGSGSSSVNWSGATAAGEPAHAELSVAATVGAATAVYTPSQYNTNASPSMQFYGATARTTSFRMFVGMSDVSTIANQTNSATPSQNYAGFRAQGGIGTWQCVSDNASASPTVTSTSVSVVAGEGHRFEVILNSGSNIIYKIDNVVVCTHTTKLPNAGVNMRIISTLGTTTASSTEMHVSWLYAESNY